MESPVDFIDYCGNIGQPLPVPVEELVKMSEAPAEDAKKPLITEKGQRTGCKEGLYPPQYFSGQYPDLYKIPIAADAMYYQKYKK